MTDYKAFGRTFAVVIRRTLYYGIQYIHIEYG